MLLSVRPVFFRYQRSCFLFNGDFLQCWYKWRMVRIRNYFIRNNASSDDSFLYDPNRENRKKKLNSFELYWNVHFLVCDSLFKTLRGMGQETLILENNNWMSKFCFLLIKCPEKPYLYIVTVTAALGYLMFYAVGLGPVSWVIIAELFDSNTSGKANSIISFFSWSANFFVTVSFPFLEVST